MEIGKLARVLNFNDEQLAVLVLGKDIYAVELVVLRFLIRFTFEKLLYRHLFAQK